MATLLGLGWLRRYLRENLVAMHHLPPSAHVPSLGHPTSQSLLTDLLSLPDTADPYQWLEVNRHDLIERVLLREAVWWLGALALKENRVEDSRQATAGSDERLHPHVRSGPPYEAIIDQIDREDPFDLDPDTLMSNLLEIKSVLSELLGVTKHHSISGDLGDFINELLADAPNIAAVNDTIARWPELAAFQTLYYVMRQCFGIIPITSNKPLYELRPNSRAKSGGLLIKVRSIQVYASHFVVHAQAIVRRNKITNRTSMEIVSMTWGGFHHIKDDRSNSYITQVGHWRKRNRLFNWSEEIELICYPRIADGVRSLAMTCNPGILWLDRIDLMEQTISEEAVEVGDITVRCATT